MLPMVCLRLWVCVDALAIVDLWGAVGGACPHRPSALGNNPTSIVRVLARPTRFGVWDDPVQDTGSPALSSADKWADNFVWKPTWSRLKPCPPEYRRGAKDVRQRQMLNHLMAVEPLCTKDSLVSGCMPARK